VVGAAALPGGRPYHDPAQIRRIHSAGHEIASHSHQHEWLPGIGSTALRETLRQSKDALEQCIGAPVETFVPPYNQPFDHAAAGSFSLSERRTAGPDRIDVARLCGALGEAGYRTCRVSYRPAYQRVLEWIAGRRLDRPVRTVRVAGVTCVRLNTPGGFATETAALVERCARSGGIAVVYGHPHSLRTDSSQSERWLLPLLQLIRSLRERRMLQIRLPRHLSVQN
jgi:peptidoglycan/xylan/chitin deacetylase (PgdA/CDA1 family)